MADSRRLVGVVALAALVVGGGSGAAVANTPEGSKTAESLEAARLAYQEKIGPSHASGDRPELGRHHKGETGQTVQTMRIGLRYSYRPDGSRSEFYSFNHPATEVTGTAGEFDVTDLSTGDVILTETAGTVVTVQPDGDDYLVSADGGEPVSVAGPVRFSSDAEDNAFAVPSIVRLNIITWADYLTPEYRGELEVSRGPSTPDGTVNLVNIVELENYVRGVVINESPAYFHPESLKSQVTAARGYAVANVGRFAAEYPFDLDDSALSQVYRGKTAEHPNGNTAADATVGLVTTYDAEIISAYYSSSMAGHPDSVEWSLGGIGEPERALPYLVGRYDGPEGTEPDLSTEEGLREFWANDQPQVYDSRDASGNSRNRWSYTVDREAAETAIENRASFAEVVSGSPLTIGELQECEGTKRSPTGRIVVAECTGSEAVWRFTEWDQVRRLIPSPTLGVLNNPNFYDENLAEDGSLESITVIGGGWGHNIGMSQYGAHGRGRAGQSFAEILTFYYKDTTVGSAPVELKGRWGRPKAVSQEFSTVDGTGVLQVRDAKHLAGLVVEVNGAEAVKLTPRDLWRGRADVDISEYLEPGLNKVTYKPVGPFGSATALVEIYS